MHNHVALNQLMLSALPSPSSIIDGTPCTFCLPIFPILTYIVDFVMVDRSRFLGKFCLLCGMQPYNLICSKTQTIFLDGQLPQICGKKTMASYQGKQKRPQPLLSTKMHPSMIFRAERWANFKFHCQRIAKPNDTDDADWRDHDSFCYIASQLLSIQRRIVANTAHFFKCFAIGNTCQFPTCN